MKRDELGFQADYSVEEVCCDDTDYVFHYKRPGKTPDNYLNLEVPTCSSDYFSFKVESLNGNKWTGRFEPGVEGISAIFGTPANTVCCIIVKGQAYWIPVDDPVNYHLVPSFPVKRVFAIPEKNLMVFVDYTRLTAYGASGARWRTPRLSSDGVEITDISPQKIRGKAWDASEGRQIEFSVDVVDGKSHGGVNFING